jgi:membrane fusion protein
MENLFRHEAIEHNRKKLEGNISLVQPPAFRYLTILIILIVLFSLLFLVTGTYTRKERVTGSLQPIKGVVKLVASKKGVVEDMFVSEGSNVEKGDTILSIRSEKYGENGEELNETLINQYEFQIDALNLQIESEKQQNTIKIADLKFRLESLKVEYEQFQNNKSLLNKRVAINKDIKKQVGQLLDTGYISELELKRQSDSVLALQHYSTDQRYRKSIK